MAQQSTAGEITAFLDQLAGQAEITDFIQNLGRDLVASKDSQALIPSTLGCRASGWVIYSGATFTLLQKPWTCCGRVDCQLT
jgi:hypothetical protein